VITLIVPTRNRAYALRLVAPSYYEQFDVDEIVFVDDAGTDDTCAMLERLSRKYPGVTTKIVRNARRVGASEARNLGVAEASNEFVLFCDDDEYLEQGYARTCLAKLLAYDAGAVSGRRIYLEEGESQDQALQRFGTGWRRTAPFQRMLCEIVNAAKFTGDLSLPFTNAIVLTRKSLVHKYPYDPYYARGNGYREESDYQMNLFVRGYPIYVTNERHSFHLPKAEVNQGGQRMRPIARIYWSVHYTRYFYRKYYTAYSRKVHLRTPRPVALTAFALFVSYRELVRTPLQDALKRVRSRVDPRASARPSAARTASLRSAAA